MDKLLIKRGSKRALEQLDPLQVGELFLAKDEERLYVGGPRGNISLPTQKDLDEKATKTELQQVSLAYKESYDTLDDLKNAYPNGDVYNHVVLADGMIYTYVNGEWISTGVKANGAIEFMKAYEDLKVLGVGGRNLLPTVFDLYNLDGIYGYIKISDSQTMVKIYDKDVNVDISGIFFGMTGTGRDASGGYKWIVRDGTIDDNYYLGVSNNYPYFSFFPKSKGTFDKIFRRFYIKIEKGNKATDWTPAPEDIDAHPFVVELAETIYRSKQNEERIRDLEEKLISN